MLFYEEVTEDIYHLRSSAGGRRPALAGKIGGFRSFSASRLLVTLMGGVLAGQVSRGLEDELSRMMALAFLFPAYRYGGTGTQSSTLTVRGLATGQIEGREALITVLKESLVGMSMRCLRADCGVGGLSLAGKPGLRPGCRLGP